MNKLTGSSRWLKLSFLALIIGLFFGLIFIRNNPGFKAKLFSNYKDPEPAPSQIDDFTIEPILADPSIFASMDDVYIPTGTGIIVQTFATLDKISQTSPGSYELIATSKDRQVTGYIGPETQFGDADYYLDSNGKLDRIGIETVGIERLDSLFPGQWLRLTYRSDNQTSPLLNILELLILE